MKSVFHILVAASAVAALPFLGAQAQTTRKPAPRPAATKPTAKPASKPTPAPTSQPKAQPAPASEPEPSLLETALPTTFTTGPFQVGTRAINLGIGVGSRYNYGMKVIGGSSTVSPAISLSYEKGLMAVGPGVLGAGIFAGYQGAKYVLTSGDKWKYTDVMMTVRGSFHYPVTPEFDAYGGVGVGVRHSGVSFEGSNPNGLDTNSSTGLAYGLFVGGRYFLFENFGAFAELGYDQTYLKVGLTGKF
ncbi:outer membrane protein [Hymenobacter sedentarius]|uniref:outer membrane protein n=1 Tax=Hymenobacter sedentarius TaxID=1411621 RepID=UPI000A845F1C|nr:hypothetical protein [Hymenobacter sedentarius]